MRIPGAAGAVTYSCHSTGFDDERQGFHLTKSALHGLDLLNRWALGEENPWATADWEASWKRGQVNEEEWQRLREKLRRAAQAWQKHVTIRAEWDDMAATGALAIAADTSYHRGAIREIMAAGKA